MSMSDKEFLEELARRLNVLLERDLDRMNGALSVPMASAGYSNLGHFLGALSLAPRLTSLLQPRDIYNRLFLAPVIEDRKIVRFEVLTGLELERRSERAASSKPPGTGKFPRGV